MNGYNKITILMRQFVLMLSLLLSTWASAQGIGKIKFGSSHDVALKAIEATFGTPSKTGNDVVVFANKDFEGFRWDEVQFKFKNGVLNEARFFMNQKTKAKAKSELDVIAKALGKKHEMSVDYEDDGNRFYSGGHSPAGFGRLFQAFISPRKGAWSDQLRFGPYQF